MILTSRKFSPTPGSLDRVSFCFGVSHLTPEARSSALLRALRDCASDLGQGAIVSLDWSGPPCARVLPAEFLESFENLPLYTTESDG
jgi:hypothetical protein